MINMSMQESSNPVFDRFAADDYLNVILPVLRKYNSNTPYTVLAAGGIVTKILAYPNSKELCAINLYVDFTNASNVITDVDTVLTEIYGETELLIKTQPAYDCSPLRKSGIMAVFEFIRDYHHFNHQSTPVTAVKVMVSVKTPMEVVSNLDMTSSECWYDGFQVGGDHIEDTMHRKTVLRKPYCHKLMDGDGDIMKQVVRHKNRGFKVQLQTKGPFAMDEGKREYTNLWIKYLRNDCPYGDWEEIVAEKLVMAYSQMYTNDYEGKDNSSDQLRDILVHYIDVHQGRKAPTDVEVEPSQTSEFSNVTISQLMTIASRGFTPANVFGVLGCTQENIDILSNKVLEQGVACTIHNGEKYKRFKKIGIYYMLITVLEKHMSVEAITPHIRLFNMYYSTFNPRIVPQLPFYDDSRVILDYIKSKGVESPNSTKLSINPHVFSFTSEFKYVDELFSDTELPEWASMVRSGMGTPKTLLHPSNQPVEVKTGNHHAFPRFEGDVVGSRVTKILSPNATEMDRNYDIDGKLMFPTSHKVQRTRRHTALYDGGVPNVDQIPTHLLDIFGMNHEVPTHLPDPNFQNKLRHVEPTKPDGSIPKRRRRVRSIIRDAMTPKFIANRKTAKPVNETEEYNGDAVKFSVSTANVIGNRFAGDPGRR